MVGMGGTSELSQIFGDHVGARGRCAAASDRFLIFGAPRRSHGAILGRWARHAGRVRRGVGMVLRAEEEIK